jgi:hypothetical protein
MASPTTTLPSATLAALGGEAAHASAAPMLVAVVAVPRLIHGLGADLGATAVLALPLMKRTPVLVEA